MVVDELMIELPDDGLLSLLAAEVDAVDGVSVESIRRVEPDRADMGLLALAVGARVVEASSLDRQTKLCEGMEQLIEADWVALVGGGSVMLRRGRPPTDEWLLAFDLGAGHLDSSAAPRRADVDSDLVWASLPRSRLTVAAGRTARPIHHRERERVAMLSRLADALLDDVPPL